MTGLEVPRVYVLAGDRIGSFAMFTFPAYRRHCYSADLNVVAIGLVVEEEPAGLALGLTSSKEGGEATMLSIFVAESHRRRGFGRALLNTLESELAGRGCRTITGRVSGSQERSLIVERLLAQSGWQFSGPTSILCRAAQAQMLKAPWLAAATLPKEMELFPWLQLLPSERAGMLEQQALEPWIPRNLNPFWNEALIAGCSLGMRFKGRVAGWCVAYKFEADSLRWWRLFVVKDLQRMARAVPLLAETIRRAPSYGFHFGVWSVQSDNKAMMRLLTRRMQPYLISAKPVWTVSRRLETSLYKLGNT